MSRKNLIKTRNLSRLICYILEHKPYEFGLLPDSEGFVKYRDLLQAIHEEQGWGYVKEGNINEVLLGTDGSLFQTADDRIRSKARRWKLNLDVPCRSVPKILFTGIRRRAHPVIMEKGLIRTEGIIYLFSPDRRMAERLGKRRDNEPVILEITADSAIKKGALIYAFGDLFIAFELSPEYIAGPAVPKSVIKAKEEKAKKAKEPASDFQPGSFILDISMDPHQIKKPGGRKKKGWKEEIKRQRRKRDRRIIP